VIEPIKNIAGTANACIATQRTVKIGYESDWYFLEGSSEERPVLRRRPAR